MEPLSIEGRLDHVASALLDAIRRGDVDGVFGMFSAPMREAMPLERTRAFVAGIPTARGEIVSHARRELRNRTGIYVVTAARGEWEMQLVLDSEDRILGLRFGDPPAPPPQVARTTQALRLPFRGEWTVFWGGATEADNIHVAHHNQRRAADLLITDAEGRTHRGEGTSNSDYYAYGREILAAGAGRVVVVIDGVPENAPRTGNPYFALGNAVMIEGAPGEVALYAHLQPRTIRVREGQRVRAGQLLGLCGNSGNATEPHLHFHVQDRVSIVDAWGVEAVFERVAVQRGGTTTTTNDYTFTRGDRVREAAPVESR